MDANSEPTTELAATLRLSSQALAKLKERANGHSLSDFLSQLVEGEMRRPSIDEILAPVRAEFAATGMTDVDILDLGRQELEALRRKKKQSAP